MNAHVSVLQENTVSRCVHSSINNAFIVKTKDTLKKSTERKTLKIRFAQIL